MIKRYWQRGRKQKTITIAGVFILLLLLFLLRDDYQPVLLFLRKYFFILLVCAVVLFFGLRRFRNSLSAGRRLLTLLMIGVFFGILYLVGWHLDMYAYMKTYSAYQNLNRTELSELPLSQNERIQPLRNIASMAGESVGETKDVSLPHLVRVDGENKWTMVIQPAEKYVWQRINSNIEEIFSVPSTSPFPRFSSDNRIPVTFSIGESLKFSRNTYNAAVKKFNLFQLFTMQPADVFYMKNDSGNWVQVVSLIKWKGFFFPYPTFGGVMVIDSGKHNFNDYLERLFVGKGTFISPEEIKNHPYLTRQNILAEEVSQLQAESLKFIGGFSDPLPWNMETAVKIPDLPDDQNQQPYVTDFNFEGTTPEAYNGLYHWFGLEPIGDERTSLTFSVFIPADGSDKVFYYDHATKKEGMGGVSAMPLKVIESRKEYDWTANKPVEFRPYIREIAGRKRMFFLGTISAVNQETGEFDGSSTPDLALIDSEYRDVVWVDSKNSAGWDKAIEEQLMDTWRANERNERYFQEETHLQMEENAVQKDTISNIPIQEIQPSQDLSRINRD